MICSLYSAASTQEDIFEHEVKPLICRVVKGFNATIFAYGATGSGKSHTIIGSDKDPGIIPRSVRALLEGPSVFLCGNIPERARHSVQLQDLQVSFMEIYNNKVTDLLGNKDRDLSIREDQDLQVHCPDLTKIKVESMQNFLDIFGAAKNARSTAATNLNDQSSRSHAMLMLHSRYSDGVNMFRFLQVLNI